MILIFFFVNFLVTLVIQILIHILDHLLISFLKLTFLTAKGHQKSIISLSNVRVGVAILSVKYS